jgi:hypothetical protein
VKYDPITNRVERDAADKERHRQIREKLRFPGVPAAADVEAVVDSLVNDGALSEESGTDNRFPRH